MENECSTFQSKGDEILTLIDFHLIAIVGVISSIIGYIIARRYKEKRSQSRMKSEI